MFLKKYIDFSISVTKKEKLLVKKGFEMKKIDLTSKTLYIVSIVVITSAILRIIFDNGWSGFYLNLIFFLSSIFLSLCIAYNILLIIFNKEFHRKTPILISLIAFLIFYFRPIEYIIEKTKSPILYSGYCEHTMGGHSITLRKDKSFIYDDSFLTKDVFYGNYILSNDTIYLNYKDSIPKNPMTILYIKENKLDDINQYCSYYLY